MATSEALDDFFADCPEMLFVTDRDGGVLRLSGLLARLLGPEAREGMKLVERVHPEDQAAFVGRFAELAAGASSVRFDARLRDAADQYRLFACNAQAARARGGERGEVVGSLREVGPERARVAALEGRAEILRILEETLPLAVWVVDRQGTFIQQEGRALGEAGVPPNQYVGLNAFSVPLGQGVEPAIRQALAGTPTHILTTMEEHGIPWESWQVPLRDNEGQIKGVVCMALDVSESKRAERELRTKIALIERQQQVIQALSTPIIEVWDKVLTLPMVGLVDSVRIAEVMDNLLMQVSRKGARFAILDLTGVEAVDTGTASHLLKLIQALRLLGAEGIITGIQPEVAQTMVALGMNLETIITLANLRDGLRLCMKRMREAEA